MFGPSRTGQKAIGSTKLTLWDIFETQIFVKKFTQTEILLLLITRRESYMNYGGRKGCVQGVY